MLEAQDTIKKLEEQLKLSQAAKEDLEARQNELQAMMTRLEETKVCTNIVHCVPPKYYITCL